MCDWSSDVCASDRAAQLARVQALRRHGAQLLHGAQADLQVLVDLALVEGRRHAGQLQLAVQRLVGDAEQRPVGHTEAEAVGGEGGARSEEHTSELQSLMRTSYAVFCLKKNIIKLSNCPHLESITLTFIQLSDTTYTHKKSTQVSILH